MQKRILITGVSGVGKSTICKELQLRGYNAIGIEDIKGMFDIYHKGTRRVFKTYNNLNPKHLVTADWLCDTKKLKKLVGSQKADVAFYCGISSDIDELLPFFDPTIVLQVNKKILNERLKTREGTDNIGNNQVGRDTVMGWKDWWEGKMRRKGATFIDAGGSPQKTAEKVLSALNFSPTSSYNL